MRIFVLEDEIHRYPRNQIIAVLASHTLTLATSFEDAKVKFVGDYDLMLLDHDMEGFHEKSDHPNTGFQFCKWFVDGDKVFGDKKPQIVLHSQNPVGRKNMRLLLEENGFDVVEMPFGPDYVKVLKTLQ